MRAAWCLTLVLFVVAPAHSATDCVGSRLVAVGSGCVDLPCDYQAVSTGWAVDIGGGYFKSRATGSQIEWIGGSISFPLGVGPDERVVWRWPAVHGWRFWWHALTESAGKQSYRVANHSLALITPAESPDALNRLKNLAASYTVKNGTQCQQPEREKP
jgi:hypothetical protein